MKLKHHISFLLNFGKFSPVIQSILSPLGQKTAAQQSSRKDYTRMQKGLYEDLAHYAGLKGTTHHDYWADSWIFLHGTKK